YWLTNCVGFSIAGGGRGTVERLLADDDPHFPAQLEIRQGHRLRRLSVSAVVEVVPEEQVLVVHGAKEAAPSRAALDRVVVVLRHVAVAAGVLVLGFATWLVRAGKETVRLVRSLPWQQSARSVRSVTTTLWRDLSTRLSLLLTTSSGRRRAKRSS